MYVTHLITNLMRKVVVGITKAVNSGYDLASIMT